MNKKKISKFFSNFSRANILCIGDLILDTFIEGEVNRISPEAPVPILQFNKSVQQIGGAGNVARNISSLGGKVGLLSLVGYNDKSKKVVSLCKKIRGVKPLLVKYKDYKIPEKIRYSSRSNQLLRVDNEVISPDHSDLDKKIIKKFINEVKNYNTVLISNYNKGTLSKKTIKKIIDYCKEMKIQILIDPKNKDFSIYKNADIITPNRKELLDALNINTENDTNLIRAAKSLREMFNFGHILLTKSEKGMTLISKKSIKTYPTAAKDVYDVTGAGDTVIAVMAIGHDIGLNIQDSVLLANMAAGIVVGKKGAAVATKNELIDSL